jgi:hypothetical protein
MDPAAREVAPKQESKDQMLKDLAHKTVTISAPRMGIIEFALTGTAPYMQARFAEKAMQAMKAKLEAGSVSRKGKRREPRDFDFEYRQAMHRSTEGWAGIPAGAFRQAAVSACRLVGFKMTLAKLSIFVEADGLDAIDGTPLIRIEGEPEPNQMPVRNATGVLDIRVRPMWREWRCKLRIRYDQDQFTATDVANLVLRIGEQVGIGEGRPDSKSSTGLGFGLFAIKQE